MLSINAIAQESAQESIAKGGLSKKMIDIVREQMSQHKAKAYGWARMAEFDEALRELALVEDLFQSINGRITEPSRNGPATYYKLNNEQTFQLVASFKIRAETYKETLRRFELPIGTFSDFKIIPIPIPGNKECIAVIYTTPPAGLEKKQMALNPSSYQEQHITGSRSFVKIFRIKSITTVVADTVFESEKTYEVPEGFTPFYCEPPYSESYELVVHLAGANEMSVNGRNRGAMLFKHGKLLELLDGPSKGSVVILPTIQDYHLNGYSGNYAYRNLGKNLSAVSVLDKFKCKGIAHFEGDQITEYLCLEKDGKTWSSRYKAGNKKSIDTTLVEELSHIYAIRKDMANYGYTRDEAFKPHSIIFDKNQRQWTTMYGDLPEAHVISGSTTYVVIDETGKLIYLHKNVTPR